MIRNRRDRLSPRKVLKEKRRRRRMPMLAMMTSSMRVMTITLRKNYSLRAATMINSLGMMWAMSRNLQRRKRKRRRSQS
jgi:hypothetical protein